MTRRSPSRNTASPRLRKISSTVSPAAASISQSESKNGKLSRAARRRPILVLPAPINPTRTIVRFGTKAVAGASARAFGRVWIFTVLFCIPRRSSAGHAGRVLAYRAAFSPTGAAGAAMAKTGWDMGKVAIILIVILVLAIASGFVVLAYWDIPAPASHVDKVLPG